ncbi:hypothetical protein U1Q18_020739 [Sarracenia purpurea var. burkii]
MEKVAKPWVRGSCVGRGSYGTVSVAVGELDGEVFAVKSVDRSSGSASQLEALENEIRILRSLSSSWVVKYLHDDVTVEGGATEFRNLHLEYLPAGNVADLANQCCAGVDEGIVRSYTWCVVSALRCVHSKGIVHCDVKGKNVLVGSIQGAAKLADFGSATEFAELVSMPRGSPLWMAPEVIRREYQGPESDVWSLGCTLIEMVTGKPAWEDNGVDTLRRIGYSDDFPEFPNKMSELGLDFLDKCLRRNRTERWTCDQLLHHPFISSSAPPNLITYSSPRCVLDFLNSNLRGDDEEHEEKEEETDHCIRRRIGKLASNGGVIWESDGWVMVRNLMIDEAGEDSDGLCCGGDEDGTSSEYPNSNTTTTGGESEGTSTEYSDSNEIERTNLEYVHSGGGFLVGTVEFGGAGSSCRYGSPGPNWAVDYGQAEFTTGI